MEIVVVVIRNSKGQYFIHKRREDKKTYPDLYALGIGGGVEQGESVDMAASRELKEEAGISTPVRFLFSMDMKDIGLGQTVYVFELLYDKGIKNCEEEWQWSGWMTEKEVDALADSNQLCPDTAEYYKKYKKI
ncbi:MAG: NUDIX domain-containing protein [Candidatus Berkelbacteria bacterium]|nr:NUDIX domain-containing protein [Candidatus Berkelbacteria bacterium]